MRGSWSYRSMLLVAGCALAVGLWARINNLGSPSSRVFDETCFSAFAYNYLQGLPVFDLPTPLGKFVLAAVIALLGDTRLAWRLMPALFGCALLIVGAVFGWCYTKERVGALLLAAFVASETILVVYSRTGLPDGILLFFILATLLTALHAERKIQVIWPAVLLGLSVGVNWASLGLVVPVGYVLWRKGLLKLWTACGSRSSSTFSWFTLGRSPAGSETRCWRGQECESGISTPLAASLCKSTTLELHPGGVGRSCCSR